MGLGGTESEVAILRTAYKPLTPSCVMMERMADTAEVNWPVCILCFMTCASTVEMNSLSLDEH